jgi:hypothetical protein
MATNDSRDDLDHWLDGLRGRDRADAPAATRAEARAQRPAIIDAHRAAHAASPDDPQELQRLLFRLRREGLLGAEAHAAAHPWRRRLPVAAAAVLALGLAITMIGPGLWQAEEEPVLRSGAAVQTLEADPSQVEVAALRVQQALLSAGATVTVNDIGGGAREVAATVPKERLAEAARALAPLGLRPPAADGTLRVEVRPRAAESGP